MIVSKIIYLDRGVSQITAMISGDFQMGKAGKMELLHFQSDEILRPGEIAFAKGELTHKACGVESLD